MNEAKFYGVYTARFPFLESEESKIRPVIVVSKPHSQYNVVAVIPVSSTAGGEQIDVHLDGLNSAGLLRPSIARVHRLTNMLQSQFITELGDVEADDVKNLQTALRQFLSL